jgi:N-acetylglucosamine transport system substrate-binding protein
MQRWIRNAALAASAVYLALGAVSCGSKRGAEKAGALNVAAFKGGYGLDFFEDAAKEFETERPGTRVKVWGNPRVWEQLRPLFVAGKPPDLTYPGWGMDHWPLVYENQLMPLDEALAGKPWSGDGKWADTFEPALLKLGQHDGKQWMLPYFYNINGWWYDKALFAKHGWTPPKTWSELLALCAKIKAAGIAPITYQGKYPYYALHGFLFPWVVSAGGIQAFDDMQNLKPGAWKSAAVIRAASMIRELADKGYFQSGSNGMSHTESQMEFVNGRAAMIPCGTWLNSEMREQLPKSGFEMAFFLPPTLDAGIGDPTNIDIGIEPWVVPSKGKNHGTAIDFYKYMTSLPKAKQFVERKGTLTAIKGSDEVKLPPFLVEPAAAFRASKAIWSVEYIQWYPKLGTASQNATAALLAGTVTPQEYAERLEAAAELARKDTETPRHTVTR